MSLRPPLRRDLTRRMAVSLRPVALLQSGIRADRALHGEIDRLPALSTAGHRFGPRHAVHAGFERDHGAFLYAEMAWKSSKRFYRA